MKQSSERLVYFLLIVGLITMSTYLGQAIFSQVTETGGGGGIVEGPDPTPVMTALPSTDVFALRDLGKPILTPVPTATPAPTAIPTPTPIPYADKWYVTSLAPPNFAKILNENLETGSEVFVRVGKVYSESLKEIDESRFAAGKEGVKILSINPDSVSVRNYDGRTKEVKRNSTTTPKRRGR